ncbi:MAG: penicillin-binding protein 1C [Verrucomicrobia bacterium]|nr:penicillin-binding protein 1C [Verrucomicrobiota bacterium]
MRFRLYKLLRLVGLAVVLLVAAAWVSIRLAPLPSALLQPSLPSPTFTDRHGSALREVLVDDSRFVQPLPLRDIPQALVNATLAAEDKRFWSHHGVDVVATARAAWGLVAHRRVVSGASTITQQLVKIHEPPRRRTPWTKVTEALKALRLEQLWSKNRILETYLNRLDYGNLRIGCAAAARYYFGKAPADLSLAEGAFLAGLPQAPARMNPHVHFQSAKDRQARVLTQMLRNGFITAAEYQRASVETLRLSSPRRVFQAPHFMDLVLQQTDAAAGAAGEIRTTVDVELTRVVEQYLRERIGRLHPQQVHNGAVVVIDNRTGGVLALVGSEDYFAPGSGQVNGAWARRSPGSALKPFTYLLAFEHGANPATVVADLPTEFVTPTGTYSPANFNHRCYGPMRYRLALANSLNISAVKVLNSIGGCEVLLRRLRDCGITTLNQPAAHYGLGLTLGNAEVRLLELTNAYACLARLGEYKPWRLVPDEVGKAPALQACDRLAAYLIADILSDSFARALAFGMNSSLRFEFPVACKTGTSTDFRDNWALGFTPEFTVGVWVGNFDGQPMERVSGITGATPILHDVFEFLHQRYGTSWYAPPEEIIERAIHPVSGKLLANPTAAASREMFIATSLPPEESPGDYDAQGRIRLGDEYTAWFNSGANWLTDRAVLDESIGTPKLCIVAPSPGSTCVLDPDLPAHGRILPLVANGTSEGVWSSATLEVRNEAGSACAILSEGRHELTVRNPATGETVKTWILVKSL